MTRKFFEQTPKFYGLFYLALIPVYALLYYFMPQSGFKFNDCGPGIWSSLYLSVVTITTLGFGDITPIKSVSQMVVSSESVLGITFIGLFLNSLSHDRSSKEALRAKISKETKQREDQIKKLQRFDNVGRNYISLYQMYMRTITTPMDRRIQGQEWDSKFTLNDMRDLFKPSILLTDASYEPAIKKYFKFQKQLEAFVTELLFTVDLKYWPELEALCSNYITFCQQLDFSDYILNQPNMKYGDKKAVDVDSEMLEKYDGDYEFPKHANSISPYIALYKQIKIQLEFIEKYQLVINKIKNETQPNN